MKRVLSAVVLALAACGPSGPPPEPDSPQVAACRREARASDEYRDFFRSASPAADWRQAHDAGLLENRLIRACLEREGLLRPGVEPVNPPAPDVPGSRF